MRKKLRLLDKYEMDLTPTIPDLDFQRFLNDWRYRNEMAQLANEARPVKHLDDVPSHRYTTYANLGTALIHQSLKPAMSGDKAAAAKLTEGSEFIRMAIQHHPGAHGHREGLAKSAVTGLIAKLEDPSLWLKYDIMGNPLVQGSMHDYLKKVEHLHPFVRPGPTNCRGPISPHGKSTVMPFTYSSAPTRLGMWRLYRVFVSTLQNFILIKKRRKSLLISRAFPR